MPTEKIGAAAALATAFHPDGSVDGARMGRLARRLLDRGLGRIGLFGTTGEGASVAAEERGAAFDAVIAAGVPAERLIAGVSAASIGEAAAQWRVAAERGCKLTLVTPPFYYKNVDEDGVERWFSALFERMDGAGEAILYTIPSVTSVPVSAELAQKLKGRFPDVVAGVKDSTGSLENTLGLIEANPDLQILVGHEPHIAEAVKRGATGAISGLANVQPERVAALVGFGLMDDGLDALVSAITAHPVIPAIKALLAYVEGDPAWAAPRPPLVALDDEAAEELIALFAGS